MLFFYSYMNDIVRQLATCPEGSFLSPTLLSSFLYTRNIFFCDFLSWNYDCTLLVMHDRKFLCSIESRLYSAFVGCSNRKFFFVCVARICINCYVLFGHGISKIVVCYFIAWNIKFCSVLQFSY